MPGAGAGAGAFGRSTSVIASDCAICRPHGRRGDRQKQRSPQHMIAKPIGTEILSTTIARSPKRRPGDRAARRCFFRSPPSGWAIPRRPNQPARMTAARIAERAASRKLVRPPPKGANDGGRICRCCLAARHLRRTRTDPGKRGCKTRGIHDQTVGNAASELCSSSASAARHGGVSSCNSLRLYCRVACQWRCSVGI
jgi:hypothetical protein